MLPHEDNVLNKFRIWKERHIQMRENRASHQSPGRMKNSSYYMPRSGFELTTFRTPQRQTRARCPTPLLTRPRRRYLERMRETKPQARIVGDALTICEHVAHLGTCPGQSRLVYVGQCASSEIPGTQSAVIWEIVTRALLRLERTVNLLCH